MYYRQDFSGDPVHVKGALDDVAFLFLMRYPINGARNRLTIIEVKFVELESLQEVAERFWFEGG